MIKGLRRIYVPINLLTSLILLLKSEIKLNKKILFYFVV